MAHVISPRKDEMADFRTPLEPGETRVLDLLDEHLDPEWEIYVQPHLNGCRPDFVLLNPHVGIGIIEVKDWDLEAMHYRRQLDSKGVCKLMATRGGRTFSVQDPVAQVRRYKREIYELYCPRLSASAGLAAVAAGVVFPFADEAEVNQLFRSDLPTEHEFVAGRESIGSGDIT